MIDLTSLKEQLALLGHSLPDSQILSILHDMNIEVDGTEAQQGVTSQPEVQLPASSSKYAHLVNAPLVLPPQLPTLLEEEDEVITEQHTVAPTDTHKAYNAPLGGTELASSYPAALLNSQAHASFPTTMQGLSQPAPITFTSAAIPAPAAATRTALGSSQHAQHVTLSIRPNHMNSATTLLGATAPLTAASTVTTAPIVDTGTWLGSAAVSTAAAAPTTLLGRGTTGTLLPTTTNATLTHLNNLYNTSSMIMSGTAPTGVHLPQNQAELTATAATGTSLTSTASFTTGTSGAWRGTAAPIMGASEASAAAAAAAAFTSGSRYGSTAASYAGASAGRPTQGGLADDDDDDDRVQDILGRYYGRHTGSSQSESLSTEPSLTHLGGRSDAACVMGVTDRAAYASGSKSMQTHAGGSKCDYGSEKSQWPGSDAVPTRDQVQKASAMNHAGSSVQASDYLNEVTYMPGGRSAQVAAGSSRLAGASQQQAVAYQRGAAGSKARTKYDWQDALRTDADDQRPASSARPHSQAGSVPQRRSSSGLPSRPSTAGSATAAAGGAKRKTDVVSRYAQLQAGWQQDRFLNSMGGGSGSKTAAVHRNRSTAVASGRKLLNFHQYFRALHAAEAAERDMMSKMTRAYTTDSLKPATAANPKQRR